MQATGGDSTSVNTGWKGGCNEPNRGKAYKKIRFDCDLHTGELPIRCLIQELKGTTKSNNKWTGIFGNILEETTQFEIDANFKKIEVGSPIRVSLFLQDLNI